MNYKKNILIILSFFSSRYFSFIFLIILFFGDKFLAFNFFALSLLNFLLTFLLKIIFNKKREIDNFNKKFFFNFRKNLINKIIYKIIIPDCYSFPSGHSSNSAIIVYFLIRLFKDKLKNFYLYFFVLFLLLIFYFFSILSRVYLGLHKIKDILFGFLVGIFSILIYNFFLLKYFSFLYNRLLFHFMK